MACVRVRLTEGFWRRALWLVPTYGLQAAIAMRPGVKAEFVPSGEKRTYDVTGVCWVTINGD